MRVNFSGINNICVFGGKRCSHREQDACSDFVNFDDLPARSSKMLLEGRVCAYVHMDECACIVSVLLYCVIPKKMSPIKSIMIKTY